MVSFTSVELSKDLRYAKVYYSFLGDEAERNGLRDYFGQNGKRIRQEVGRRLRVRHIPEMTFHFDTSIERSARVEELLNELHRERKKDD
jgi:ribosome-binding factor A